MTVARPCVGLQADDSRVTGGRCGTKLPANRRETKEIDRDENENNLRTSALSIFGIGVALDCEIVESSMIWDSRRRIRWKRSISYGSRKRNGESCWTWSSGLKGFIAEGPPSANSAESGCAGTQHRRRIAEAFSCRVTVENLRKRLVTEGFRIALDGKPRESAPREKCLDGKAEAKVIATSGQTAEGICQLSLRLLAQRVVELGISHEARPQDT